MLSPSTGKEIIYAKNSTCKRLAASIGEEVTAKARQLERVYAQATRQR
jgi:hypothetical protein